MNFEDLYQDVILDHSRRPRNYGNLPDADHSVHGNNPSCGDDVTIHVKFDPQDRIAGISFTGNGCSICMASASMMTQKVKNLTRSEAGALLRDFTQMLTSEEETQPPQQLGDLRLLRGVRKFPLRVKCATLAWHALEQALAHPDRKQTQFADE